MMKIRNMKQSKTKEGRRQKKRDILFQQSFITQKKRHMRKIKIVYTIQRVGNSQYQLWYTTIIFNDERGQ